MRMNESLKEPEAEVSKRCFIEAHTGYKSTMMTENVIYNPKKKLVWAVLTLSPDKACRMGKFPVRSDCQRHEEKKHKKEITMQN